MKKTFPVFACLIAILLLITGCSQEQYIFMQTKELVNFCKKTDQPLTIFIHGTLLPPGVSLLMRAFDLPLGLTAAHTVGNKFMHGRIAYALDAADNTQFPLNNFYFYGWSGKLSFVARQKAAHDLYVYLKKCKSKYINIIGHSHGGNIALNLAQIAHQYNDTSLKISRLILLATPALTATKQLIHDPLFQEVYSFYSLGDFIQVSDPQGMYTIQETGHIPATTERPLFSGRLFGPGMHIQERRILYQSRNIGHIDFILLPFIRRLPQILKLLSKHHCTTPMKNDDYNKAQHHLMINIPADDNQPVEQLIKQK